MRGSTLSLLALPGLAVAQMQTLAAPEKSVDAAIPEVTQGLNAPAPGEAWQQEAHLDEAKQLELRQATEQNLAASAATTEVPDVTSYWIASYWDSTSSTEIWVDVIYTQSFPSYPGQLSTAGSGSIGLGTITGSVGVVKSATSGGASVMPQGTLFTAAIGLVGVGIGMAAVLL